MAGATRLSSKDLTLENLLDFLLSLGMTSES